MSEPGQRVSILVVDDEPTLRMAFAFALKEEGVEVEEAPNGAEALAKHAERPFDLILMDLRMPALNGLETLARLREQGDRCPVVLCSAHLTAEDVLLALRHGVVDFLSKPVDLERLRQAKADVLEQPATPWASALSHARRMEFQQAVEDLPEETEEERTARSGRTPSARWLLQTSSPPASSTPSPVASTLSGWCWKAT